MQTDQPQYFKQKTDFKPFPASDSESTFQWNTWSSPFQWNTSSDSRALTEVIFAITTEFNIRKLQEIHDQLNYLSSLPNCWRGSYFRIPPWISWFSIVMLSWDIRYCWPISLLANQFSIMAFSVLINESGFTICFINCFIFGNTANRETLEFNHSIQVFGF